MAVNMVTLFIWTFAAVMGIGMIIVVADLMSRQSLLSGEFLQLVPPEILATLSPAVRASLGVAAQASPEVRDKLRKILMRMADGYLQEGRSEVAQQAYSAALLEVLGKYTL